MLYIEHCFTLHVIETAKKSEFAINSRLDISRQLLQPSSSLSSLPTQIQIHSHPSIRTPQKKHKHWNRQHLPLLWKFSIESTIGNARWVSGVHVECTCAMMQGRWTPIDPILVVQTANRPARRPTGQHHTNWPTTRSYRVGIARSWPFLPGTRQMRPSHTGHWPSDTNGHWSITACIYCVDFLMIMNSFNYLYVSAQVSFF